MISALKDGSPGAASVCWMCRRICVGGKNGWSCDSRESGCERSITRRASVLLSAGLRPWRARSDLPNVRHRAILGRNRPSGGADGGHSAGQRHRPLVRDHGRGRARRADPRRRVRPLQLRAGDAGARRSASRWSTSTCAATASPTGRSSTTTWRSGRTTSPGCWTRSRSRGARPRHVDGRDDRDRLRRQIPGANDVGRDQLRRREARHRRPADLQELDRHRARWTRTGPGSRILAELIAWQALSKAFLETPDGVAAIDTIQQILRDSNRIEVFTAACEAMCDMDLRELAAEDHLARARPRRRRGRDDAVGPGPGGAGQQAIFEGIPGAEKHVIRGSNHSTIFDNTAEHNRVVIDFFTRHGAQPRRCADGGVAGEATRSARGRGVRRRADPGGAPHRRLARPLRDQLHLLPQPGDVPARRARRRRRAACRSGGRSAAMVLGQALAFALLAPDRRGRRRPRPARTGRDCGRRSASGARACSARRTGCRGDVLVRGAGAGERLRLPGDRPGDDRRIGCRSCRSRSASPSSTPLSRCSAST